MKLYMFDLKQIGNKDFDFSKETPTFDLDFDVGVYDVLKKDDNYYVVCQASASKKYGFVKKIKFYETGEDKKFKKFITCPFCGHENYDSWDCADRDDDYRCETCGSEFSYERNVEVSYSSIPNLPSNIIEL